MSVLALLAACGTAPQADPDQMQAAQSAAYFAGNFSCARGDAVAVTFTKLQDNPEAYADKCVRVDAFSDGGKLYADAGDKQGGIRAAPAPLRIVVVWKNADLGKQLQLGPSFVTVTGRVRDCAAYRTHIAAAKALEAKVGHAIAPADDCGARASLYVSEATVVPTAMD
ncbi:MAG: hypothetical protein ACREHE_05890 [Rhizomicrobium sp.]